jgi:hypothetical protein
VLGAALGFVIAKGTDPVKKLYGAVEVEVANRIRRDGGQMGGRAEFATFATDTLRDDVRNRDGFQISRRGGIGLARFRGV